MRIAISIALMLSSAPAFAGNLSTALLPETGIVIAQSWSCDQRKTCGKIRSCDEATWYLYNCRWGGKLDGDDDGAPCENLCGSNN
ncbi:excalibur calcium-binding domain-containing protein [Paradevosia shaoguanensis]|uniref:excalibur calcium-binding domain-containing protein n=1 Tax=Paradevosia shaoguanensis TaxID=1335043 RepID=UPI001FE673FE|nr:excalibur calcium-binding domain-containing protein [Paradevosia shaoguanensis]